MHLGRTSAIALTIWTATLLPAAAPADDRGARVDALFAEQTRPGSPGAAVAVIQDDAIVFEKGYGLANVELDVPITPRSVFYLGSVGKQFTAMAIALLEQEGKLSLDDDVRKYVPELPDYGEPITIRHLVHHTSGVRDYLELTEMADLPLGYFRADEEVIELLARQKRLNFAPGDRYLYSNSGYFLLGVIVHRASGKTLREYAQEKIFGPLGMTSTHVHDDYTHIIKNRASSYLSRGDDELRSFITTFDRVGSGGVFSTVEDLFLWDQNFYHAKVGGKELIEKLHTRGVLDDGTVLDYAFGLSVGEHRGLRLVDHGGALGGYRSYLGRFPDERLSVIVLANLNRMDAQGLGLRIAEIYLGDRLAAQAEPAAPPARQAAVEVAVEALEPWTGTYFAPGELLARRIELRDGGLVYVRGPGNQTELAPLGDDRFRMQLPIPLEVTVAFRPGEMVVTEEGAEPTVFQRVEPVTYSAADLAAFAGDYLSEELDATYPLAVDDGVLTIVSRRSGNVPLAPHFADFFLSEDGIVSLRFRRDDEGRVTGFALSSGRVRDLEFVRATKLIP